jgi:hypothetical protein
MQAPFIAYQRIEYPHRADFPKDNHTDQPFATTDCEIFAQTTREMVGSLSQHLSQDVHADRVANGHQAGDSLTRL